MIAPRPGKVIDQIERLRRIVRSGCAGERTEARYRHIERDGRKIRRVIDGLVHAELELVDQRRAEHMRNSGYSVVELGVVKSFGCQLAGGIRLHRLIRIESQKSRRMGGKIM